MLLLLLAAANRYITASPLPEPLPPVDALSAGKGFAGVAIPDDAATVYWNPAGLALLSQQSVVFTTCAPQLESPASWSLFIANNNPDARNPFGWGILRRQVGEPEAGDQTAYRSFTVLTPIAVSYKRDNIPLGVTLKFIGERLSGSRWKYGFAADVGMMWGAGSKLFLGWSSHNLVKSGLRSFRTEHRLGFSYGTYDSPLLIGTQMRMDNIRDWEWTSRHFSYGARWSVGKKLPELRGGYIRSGDRGWITVGMSLRIKYNSTYLEYTLALNGQDRNEQAHFLTYGYRMDHPLIRALR